MMHASYHFSVLRFIVLQCNVCYSRVTFLSSTEHFDKWQAIILSVLFITLVQWSLIMLYF